MSCAKGMEDGINMEAEQRQKNAEAKVDLEEDMPTAQYSKLDLTRTS